MDLFSIPQLSGYLAYCFSLSAALQKNDKKLFLFFAVSNALFSIHHFLLGNTSAAISKIIVGSRMYLNIHFKGAVIAYPFAAIALICGYFSYKNLYSLLPVIAVIAATFTAAYSGGVKLRICFIFCCFLWLIHDIAGHSVGGRIPLLHPCGLRSAFLQRFHFPGLDLRFYLVADGGRRAD